MADISKLEQQADLLFNNVAGWEQSTLQRIGKRIKRYGKLSLADVKSINNIATVKQDMDAITKELAKVTGYNISQIEQMYGELLEEQHLANQPLYDYRGKTFVPFKDNRELQAIARAYAKTTGETMINLAKTKALCVMGANGKPIVNSADAGSRIGYIDLAAANDAICIALCSADGIAKDNAEREMHCDNMLERGLSLGMTSDDLWFDPLFLVVKGMQDKQMEVLEAIKMFSDKGLKSTGGLSNNSNGAPKHVRPIMDATLVAMCMMQGLTSAIVNPNDLRLMETIKSCDIFKNHTLYSDSYLDL